MKEKEDQFTQNFITQDQLDQKLKSYEEAQDPPKLRS